MGTTTTTAAPFLGNLVEICIVTSDHKRTIDGLLRLGIGPFQIHTFNPNCVSSQTYYSQPAPSSLVVCFAKQGDLVWEIMQPVSGPSIMADYLAKHGEGIHHVAFDCDHIPLKARKEEFGKRGFQLAQEGIWHGKKGTCHFTFYDTEGATSTCFESYEFSPDWEDPEDTVWYPAPPPKHNSLSTQNLPPSTLSALVPLKLGTNGALVARKGKALPLAKGQYLKLINTHGKQVIDFFAFRLSSDFQPLPLAHTEFLSMQHTRIRNSRIIPKVGDVLYSNLRKSMLSLVEDTSPGIHDTIIPACDAERYRLLGVEGYHASCAENLHTALSDSGVPFPEFVTPAPFNIFMNIPVGEDGSVSFEAPESKEGDYVVVRADENCLVVVSICPQDMNRINGLGPRDCQYEIF